MRWLLLAALLAAGHHGKPDAGVDDDLAQALRETNAEIPPTEEEAEAATRKVCGKDFHRLRVGMKFDRVKKCSGLIFSAIAEDKSGVVYSASGGYVRVEHGIVVRWVAP